MRDSVTCDGMLYQEHAAWEIAKRFGDDLIYYDDISGNPRISTPVLTAFRKLTEGSVVWVRTDRYWRKRQNDEPAGRQADY
jgi:hypothetical protein